MTLKLRREWILLSPLLLAYVLRKAHYGATFLPVFVLAGVLMFVVYQSWQSRALPVQLVAPFVLYLIWCWTALMGGAPMDSFLFLYSRAVLYFLAGVSIYQYADDAVSEAFQRLVLFLGSLETGLILFTAVAEGMTFWAGSQPAGYLQNSLHSGILLPVTFGVAIARIGKKTQPRFVRIGLILIAIACAAGVVCLRSRAGILSLGAVLFYLFPRKTITIVTVVSIGIVAWRVLNVESFLVYFEITPFQLKASLGRLSIWAAAVDAIRFHPIIGFGHGNFETAYQMFQHPSEQYLQYGKSTIFAHNGFLQTAVDTGIPGALLLFSGFGLILKHSESLLLKERALVSIIIVYAVTALTNYSLFHPFNGLVFTAAIALLAMKSNVHRALEPAIEFPRIKIPLATVTLMLSMFLTSYAASEILQAKGSTQAAARVCPIRSEAWYGLALENIRQGKDGMMFLDRAIRWNSQNSFYWHRKALVLANAKESKPEDIDQCFKQAQALSPKHAPFYLQEGFYRLQKKQFDEARLLFEKASSLEPGVPLPHYGLSLVFKEQGDQKRAAEAMHRAVELRRHQKFLMENPNNGWLYKALFDSEYARSLFGDDR